MDQKFIREKKELAYHAHIFDVYNDYLRLPDGKHVVYDLVNHVDGCCVLPVDEDGNLILVSQYRNAVDDITLEVPAGCMDEGEDPGQCAVRELEEETGYIAQELRFVTKTYLAIGTSNEQTYIYIATDLKKGIRQLDPEEFIRIRRLSLAEAMTMIPMQIFFIYRKFRYGSHLPIWITSTADMRLFSMHATSCGRKEEQM